jgi:phage shock protein PspC (stress-responsive transcriptional regulator)
LLLRNNSSSMSNIKFLLERSAFGVCTYLGARMGIASARVRLYFIYISFAALGSPILLYLFAAFWLNIKRYISDNHRVVLK